ncbi:hypothetical protein E2C01_044314 [Portunus trituberculatus]|uniref:Uncharacterized protein n=1 Tax=Portunus trituberculatus TaxID=210409 RepID=A0A5B7FYW0_PORTR|nr:hypothetical protein [Portunus trituberculatus]
MENVEAMSRTLDPSQPWVKDSRGCHTNLAALLDWPDLDSDEELSAGHWSSSQLFPYKKRPEFSEQISDRTEICHTLHTRII